MKTTFKTILFLLAFSASVYAQDTIVKQSESVKTESLEAITERIKADERGDLKLAVEAIDKQVEAKEITLEEAKTLKQTAAKKHALNIKNRVAIQLNQYELLKRNNGKYANQQKDLLPFSIGGIKITGNNPTEKKEKKKYDIRTYKGIVYSFGFNNAIIEGQSLNDSPYRVGGSGFFELGWNMQTRMLKKSNAVRINYGLSLQWNKFNIKDNQYFVNNNGAISLDTHLLDLKKVKFRRTNLVVPVLFEFGASDKTEKKDYIRYSTAKKFKFGIGGYAGVNLSTVQKIISEVDSDRVKEKIKNKYNTNDFVYGVSSYIGYGDVSLYFKYDLSPVFKNQAIKQNNVSLGVRFGL
jgi:hypothetical protein